MNLAEDHYYNIVVKSLVKASGIWHHDMSRLVVLKRVMIILVLVPYLCMQFSVLLTAKCTMTLIIRVTSFICPFTIMTVMYMFFIFLSNDILNMHNRIEEDWKLLRDKIEHDIIQKNAHTVNFLGILALSATCFIIIIFIVVQFLPTLLDVIMPLDKPRQRDLLIMVEYFDCQTKYFNIMVLHESVFIVVCFAVMCSTSTQLLVFYFHSYGMFKIARHRVQSSIENSVLQYVTNPETGRAITMKIMYAVMAHRRALEFSNSIESTTNVNYCFVVSLGLISLSINLFGIVEAITISKVPANALLYVFFVLVHLVYMFLSMLLGQTITDYNEKVFSSIYCTSWYLMPVSSQKLLLFLMQKTMKEFSITIGFIFVAKIENFTKFVNASLSYVAVMYSCAYEEHH